MDHIEIPVGDLTFRAVAAGPGSGELVVLLHGFPQSSYEWRFVQPALAEAGYRVVAPDMRGYSPGARPEGVDNYRIEHLVADVLAIADAQGGHRFHLVGHDWGAIVAWQVAGRHPDRIKTLSILSVPHPLAFASVINDDPEQQQKTSYIAFFQQPDAPEKALLDDNAAGLRAMYVGSGLAGDVEPYVELLSGPGAMTAALNYYRAMDAALTGIGKTTVPTLYVWSTNDVALGRRGAEATEQFVDAQYRFEVLDGVSHWIPDEVPEVLAKLLLDQFGG